MDSSIHVKGMGESFSSRVQMAYGHYHLRHKGRARTVLNHIYECVGLAQHP